MAALERCRISGKVLIPEFLTVDVQAWPAQLQSVAGADNDGVELAVGLVSARPGMTTFDVELTLTLPFDAALFEDANRGRPETMFLVGGDDGGARLCDAGRELVVAIRPIVVSLAVATNGPELLTAFDSYVNRLTLVILPACRRLPSSSRRTFS